MWLGGLLFRTKKYGRQICSFLVSTCNDARRNRYEIFFAAINDDFNLFVINYYDPTFVWLKKIK